jgi:hypothetical protein
MRRIPFSRVRKYMGPGYPADRGFRGSGLVGTGRDLHFVDLPRGVTGMKRCGDSREYLRFWAQKCIECEIPCSVTITEVTRSG